MKKPRSPIENHAGAAKEPLTKQRSCQNTSQSTVADIKWSADKAEGLQTVLRIADCGLRIADYG